MIAIPSTTWEDHALGEIAQIDRDGVAPESIDDGTLYVGLEHITGDGQIVGTHRVANGDLASTKFRFGNRHILYGKLRPYLRKIARPDFAGICSTDILPILPGPTVDHGYLFHFLRHPRIVDWATARCEGANLPRLSPKQLDALPIPLPYPGEPERSLAEQRRIAAILDKADAIRRKRLLAISFLSELERNVFLDFFGDPGTNPKRWPVGTIRDLVSEAQYGTSSKAGSTGRHPILRMNNITVDGDWDLSALKYIDLESSEITRFTVRAGDILFNRTNSPELVGKTAVYRGPEPMAFAGYLIRVRVNDLAVPEYIAGYLNSRHGKKILSSMCKHIIGMANINAQEMQNIRIQIPPKENQLEYAAVLASLRAKRRAQATFRDQINDLFASLIARAFRGEL